MGKVHNTFNINVYNDRVRSLNEALKEVMEENNELRRKIQLLEIETRELNKLKQKLNTNKNGKFNKCR